MRLKKIIKNLDFVDIKNFKNYAITNVTHISKDVGEGSIFICLKGNNFDGNDYIDEVVCRGAKCIITENINAQCDGCVIVVSDCRKAMSEVAKTFYNNCVDDLSVIGVVGTSGKTSTALMIAQLLCDCGKKVGVIGTNGIFIDNIRQDTAFTTPDPIDLHYIFFQMKMFGVEVVIMEVSAQAIYYSKVYGITFDIAVFTNISKEHLDFFGSMEKYAKVKMGFFEHYKIKECVVNVDDFFGREIALKTRLPCVSYGIKSPANSFAIDIDCQLDKSQFVVNIMDEVIDISVPFVGEYNIYNLLASLSVVKLMGYGGESLIDAISHLKQIEGRFNFFEKNNKKVIVDFAHTPSSIESLLQHIRNCYGGRVIVVFGCVGYSDREKRQDMSRAVNKFSDYTIITTDNRGEVCFEDIVKDMLPVFDNRSVECIEDRYIAIERGVRMLTDNSILVVVGKGAENFQTIGKERVPYSDIDGVKNLLEQIE